MEELSGHVAPITNVARSEEVYPIRMDSKAQRGATGERESSDRVAGDASDLEGPDDR